MPVRVQVLCVSINSYQVLQDCLSNPEQMPAAEFNKHSSLKFQLNEQRSNSYGQYRSFKTYCLNVRMLACLFGFKNFQLPAISQTL